MISYDQYNIDGELPTANEFMDPMVLLEQRDRKGETIRQKEAVRNSKR